MTISHTFPHITLSATLVEHVMGYTDFFRRAIQLYGLDEMENVWGRAFILAAAFSLRRLQLFTSAYRHPIENRQWKYNDGRTRVHSKQ